MATTFPSGVETGLRIKSKGEIVQYKAVTINSESKLIYADSTIIDHSKRPIGISKQSVAANKQCVVVFNGVMGYSKWTWDIAIPVFIGINGNLTQSVPVSGFIKIIGVPLSATLLLIRPETSIILGV